MREQGWALVDQELEEGLRSIAAPVRDRGGRVVAAVNVSAHASRASKEVVRRELLPPLLGDRERIEADLRDVGRVFAPIAAYHGLMAEWSEHALERLPPPATAAAAPARP